MPQTQDWARKSRIVVKSTISKRCARRALVPLFALLLLPGTHVVAAWEQNRQLLNAVPCVSRTGWVITPASGLLPFPSVIGAGAVTAHRYSHCYVCLGSNCLQSERLRLKLSLLSRAKLGWVSARADGLEQCLGTARLSAHHGSTSS